MVWRDSSNRKKCMDLFRDGTDFCLFLIGTTGRKKTDEMISIAAFRLRTIQARFQIRAQMDMEILTNDEEKMGFVHKKTKAEALEKLHECMDGVSYIVTYDMPFALQFLGQIDTDIYSKADVLEMVRDIVPVNESENFKLSTILQLYGIASPDTGSETYQKAFQIAKLLRVMYTEYPSIPFSTSNCRPWINSFWFWEGRNWHQKSVYVRTSAGDVYYNQYQRGWLSKEIENLYTEIDMDYVQSAVLKKMGLFSIDDLQKMTKKKMDLILEAQRKKKVAVNEG